MGLKTQLATGGEFGGELGLVASWVGSVTITRWVSLAGARGDSLDCALRSRARTCWYSRGEQARAARVPLILPVTIARWDLRA